MVISEVSCGYRVLIKVEDHQAEDYSRRVSKTAGGSQLELELANQKAELWWDVWNWAGLCRFIAMAFAQFVSQRMRDISGPGVGEFR